MLTRRAFLAAAGVAPFVSARERPSAQYDLVVKGGRILDYMDKGDEKRKACSLHLTIMDRMGVKLDRFGDATTRLEEL